MSGKRYSIREKNLAKKLIASGTSYNQVRKRLGVAKSTLSYWFGKTYRQPVDRNAMLAHMARIRELSKKAVQARIERDQFELTEKVRKEIANYPVKNMGFLKAMLAMLYWAEGTKHVKASSTKFANTDPLLSSLYISLLRKCYPIDESKFTIQIYLHYYHRIRETQEFWSHYLSVPISQFRKRYIKKRSRKKRFRKNFMGICFIIYKDSRVRKELLEVGRQLQGIITSLFHAPVV